MHIVADENIPLLEAFCGDCGRLTRVDGRSLSKDQLADADVLLVRSVTRVDAGLLSGTPVAFVGTATIGTDHIDTQWLSREGIAFAAAPGCNASSVVQYVLSVLTLFMIREQRPAFDGLDVGIIGAGNVGGALAECLLGLGVGVKVSDPPRQEQGADLPFASLDEVLQCDVITLHTPLTTGGRHPTRHLLDAGRLLRLRAGQLLVNSGRGAVIDNRALLERLQGPEPPLVALDVWENEPEPLPELVHRCWLATPHIAGYSLEGKARGTEMVARALHQWAGEDMRTGLQSVLPEALLSELHFTTQASSVHILHRALLACYDPRDDDSRLRGAVARAHAEGTSRGRAFDKLRKHYPVRREPSSVAMRVPPDRGMQEMLAVCGFRVADAGGD